MISMTAAQIIALAGLVGTEDVVALFDDEYLERDVDGSVVRARVHEMDETVREYLIDRSGQVTEVEDPAPG